MGGGWLGFEVREGLRLSGRERCSITTILFFYSLLVSCIRYTNKIY